jgi:LysR family transcriptional regulator, transcription activator of glutamate synthase operon
VAAGRAVVGRYGQLVSELGARRDPDGGVVRLAFLDSTATALVPRLLGGFHAEAPRIRVVLTQGPGHELLHALEAGAAELAITSTRPVGDYGWHVIERERLVVIVGPRHRLSRRKRVRLSEVVGEDLITTPTGFAYRSTVDDLLAEAGVALRISFESGDLLAVEGLVAAGLGIAIVPEQIAGRTGSVPLTFASPPARRTIGVTWRTDRPLVAPAARLLEFIRSVGNPDLGGGEPGSRLGEGLA